jgi:GNAT superfamily N-acetyltransferase
MNLKVYTLAERPEYSDQIDQLSSEAWPEFLLHGDSTNWGLLFDELSDSQLLVTDSDGVLMAVGHTAHLIWDGTIDDLPESLFDVIARAHAARRSKQQPNTVSALAAMVAKPYRQQGLSAEIIRQMISLADRAGCNSLIAPIRPILKDRYPLVPLEEYVNWTVPSGEAFDPWIRLHLRLGAELLAIADSTLRVEGTVSDWEKWTGMDFPGSGPHIVPGALAPVEIDLALDRGTYHDPNVWMIHSLKSEDQSA